MQASTSGLLKMRVTRQSDHVSLQPTNNPRKGWSAASAVISLKRAAMICLRRLHDDSSWWCL